MVKGLPLDRDGGIAVNDRMQAIPGVFAAGDVARFPEHVSGKRTRIEHWRVAGMTGRTAGLNLAGRDEPLDAVPFFWTGQFDTYVQYCGFAPEWEDIITHGDPASREFLAFFVKAGRATAACCCGMAQETQLAAVSELMRQNRLPEPDVLRKTTDFTALL
jgi:NADPH-dependent 2,4-dienoyl-CoA reductase/sulfur reductase-like enzyme